MMTISKPLSAAQAQAYHRDEFGNAQQNYYTEADRIRGTWHGKLAEAYGLRGEVQEEHFARLSQGQHPITGEQLVQHQSSREYLNEQGDKVTTMEHRAGWDATLSAPKSVSLTALVGGDERVREAHRDSVQVALDELERFVQARIGRNHPAETTGQWVAAKFEHDSARPVGGYAAPQLHTHTVFFNLTETEDGKTHAIQPQELYKSQQYATAIYRSELAHRLQELGYEIELGKSGQPEIKGYTQEYLNASSLRRQQIKEHLEEQGLRGAGAAQIAAHQTREEKLSALSHEEMRAKHEELAGAFGNQPQRVVQEAQARAAPGHQRSEQREARAQEAVTYARDRNIEREAVVDERVLMRDALRRSMGESSFWEVRQNLEHRIRSGEFVEVGRQRPEGPDRTLTTREMLDYERDNVARMKAGQGGHDPLVSEEARQELSGKFGHLSNSQRRAVDEILSSRDQVVGLEGVAGTGKTTSLAAIREAAGRQGYQVEGLAPTSRATQQLEEAGIQSSTLQGHLARSHRDDGDRHLYIVDESSLASTRQVNEFLRRLEEQDRVIFVGDTRQHQGVEAGRPFQQLQEAGMHTAHLDEIIRQKDPSLKQAVEQLAHGQVREAIENLTRQGRVHEVANREERLEAVAKAYAERPDNTLVVSPDNRSRQEINQRIHRELQSSGRVEEQEHRMSVLVPRQEMTGTDRQWAVQYAPGDIVRYTRGSQAVGVKSGEYVHVTGVDREHNLLTIERDSGQRLTYDPRRLHGVSVYRETERDFSTGDRVQFTAPYRDEHIANRQLGTVEKVDAEGNLQVRLDSGQDVQFSIREHPHVDYGYAVTSHSSQGATADRVLIHVDTEQAHEQLVNSRLAYVSVSRGRYDAQIYTNDAEKLGEELSRDVSKQSALETVHQMLAQDHGHLVENLEHQSLSESREHMQAGGHGISR
ncbi:MAG: MobF family relaxase [Terriglobia bacterium]|jgi:conjugative relaxase-like TrwC/TraI family protein